MMNKENVYDVLELLHITYPNFDITQKKIDTWTRMLKDQNPAVVMKNAERFVLNNKFPPAIAELREPKVAARTNILAQFEQWEREAVDKPRG